MDEIAIVFIGVGIVASILLLCYCCLQYCINEKKKRTTLYKRSTSLQTPHRQSQIHTFRYSLTETSPTATGVVYSQTPTYPSRIMSYPPQPPPIGFGLMPAYETSTSVVYPLIHCPIQNINNRAETNDPVNSSFTSNIRPSSLPPTYDEAIRQSIVVRT